VKSANALEVVELGRDLFVRHIIRPPIKDYVISTVLSLLHIERDGYVINRSAITNCVEALLLLSDNPEGASVYKQYLEPEILRQSDVYYKAEAARLLETCDALEYLRRVKYPPLLVAVLGLAYLDAAPLGSSTLLRRGITRAPISIVTNFCPSPGYPPGYSPHTTLANTH
jgi:Cullin family